MGAVIVERFSSCYQNQKSFNVPQAGKLVCRSSRILQEQSNSKIYKMIKKEQKIESMYIHIYAI